MENRPQKPEMTATSITLKALIIFALTLLLLIPQVMIQGLISERQERSEETIDQINAKWSRAQTLCGPVLSVPCSYWHTDSESTVKRYGTLLNIAPEELKITAKLLPEERHYGIYKTILYKSEIDISGSFTLPASVPSTVEDIFWKENGVVKIEISDLRGITDNFTFTLDDKTYSAEVGDASSGSRSALFVKIGDLSPFASGKRIPFHCKFNLNGSSDLNFVPVGRSTKVEVEGAWTSPGFIGNFSPEYTIGDGFKASWGIMHYNRNIPESWLDTEYRSYDYNPFDSASFGVSLVDPVSHYQQNMRSAKYAVMFIALTFVVFFFVEILTRRRIHLIQYLLVGIALILFYSLLLSLSEQIGFGIAYLIASTATIVLITAYAYSIFKKFSQTAILAFLLSLLYVYLYVVLQLQDIALLIGSIGLFVILGVIMYVSRKINWYKPGEITRMTSEE